MSVNIRTGLDSGHFTNFASVDVVSRVASSEGFFEKKSKKFSKIIFVPSGMSLPVCPSPYVPPGDPSRLAIYACPGLPPIMGLHCSRVVHVSRPWQCRSDVCRILHAERRFVVSSRRLRGCIIASPVSAMGSTRTMSDACVPSGDLFTLSSALPGSSLIIHGACPVVHAGGCRRSKSDACEW